MPLLGGARVGYLRTVVAAAPAAFEEELPMVCMRGYRCELGLWVVEMRCVDNVSLR